MPLRKTDTNQPRGGATFVLSLDTEIAWGSFDTRAFASYAPAFRTYRPLVRRLIDLLDRYRVPATWAFVGHLLLDRCRREKGTTHREILRPDYGWYDGEWHDHDPGTSLDQDPWWYGTDVLSMVREAEMDHEIGTHTFSHAILGDPACTPEIARSQLEACRRLHEAHGLTLRSLVFPRNRVAHLDVAAEVGITAYRGRERSWYEGRFGKLQPLAHFLDRLAAIPPRTYRWDEIGPDEHGLVNVPASMFLMPADGLRSLIPTAQRVRQAHRGLARAVPRREIFHLWFHPFNLGCGTGMFHALEEILKTAREEADAGRLDLRTMGQVSEEVLSESHAARSIA